MKIRKMVATFGCLDHAERTFSDGLNIISLPNESGKSTWCAFLLAMFYGIDTTERSKNGSIPAKIKYLPWNGAPMEGRIELLWNEREITLERTTIGKTPMGNFRAYDTNSGAAISTLTADNCGEILLGVEQSVFLRSAMIRQRDLALSADPSLEARLRALVTTGEERVTYADAQSRLRTVKNRCMANRSTGLIPQTSTALAQIQALQAQIATLQQTHFSLLSEKIQTQESLSILQETANKQAAISQTKKSAQLQQAEAELEAAAENFQNLQRDAASLPNESTLHTMQETLSEAAGAALQIPPLPAAPTRPSLPEALQSLNNVDVRACIDHDRAALEQLAPVPQPHHAFLFLIPILTVGSLLLFTKALLFGIVPLAAALVLVVLQLRQKYRNDAARQVCMVEQNQLLSKYGATSPEDFWKIADTCLQQIAIYDQKLALYRETVSRIKAQQEASDRQLEAVMEQIRCVIPQVDTPQAARTRLAQAVKLRHAADHAAFVLDTARKQLNAVRAISAESAAVASPETAAQLQSVTQHLQQVEQELARNEGQTAGLGDPLVLAAKAESLQTRLATLQEQYAAATLALDTLMQAEQILQSRFAPQISRAASSFMSHMTNGRYDAVQLDRDLSILAHQSDSVTSRPLAAFSGGTADQLYLAVRLALCETTLPTDTPLILDDALAYFDDQRMTEALSLLQMQSETRQILLFTCHSREQL